MGKKKILMKKSTFLPIVFVGQASVNRQEMVLTVKFRG